MRRLVFVCALLISNGARSADANLILNGSFEQDPVSSAAGSFTNWTRSTTSYITLGNSVTPADGKWFVNFLIGDTNPEKLSQSISGGVGNYDLSFSFLYPGSSVTTGSFRVNFGGVEVLHLTSFYQGPSTPTGANVWESYLLHVTSPVANPEVAFYRDNLPSSGSQLFFRLDNVSVVKTADPVPVPEPSTFLMSSIVCGFVGLKRLWSRRLKSMAPLMCQ
jgi:hypothetical protein